MSQLAALPVNGFEFDGLAWGAADAPVILLLHGFPQSAHCWEQVGPRLAEAGLRAVAVNQRGYCVTARPPDPSAYAMDQLVSDAVGFIEGLGGPVHLVGHDFGGAVGWQLASRHPELLRTFTAVSTPNQLAIEAVHAAVPEERERFAYMALFRQPGVAEAALLGDDARALRQLFGTAVRPDRIERDVLWLQEPGALTAVLNWYRAMSPGDGDGLGLVTVPTSYVWGDQDIAFSRALADATGRYVDADYTFLPLPGVGHWVPDQAPEALVAEILVRVLDASTGSAHRIG